MVSQYVAPWQQQASNASGRDVNCGGGGGRRGGRGGHSSVGSEGGLTLIGRGALEQHLLQRAPKVGVQAALRLAKDLNGKTLQHSRRQVVVQRHGVHPGRLQDAGGRDFLLGQVYIGSPPFGSPRHSSPRHGCVYTGSVTMRP